MTPEAIPYLGRLAPSPTGYLHLGHARTFWLTGQRAQAAGGELLLRVEDLDRPRCKPQYTAAALDDLRWMGLRWVGDPVYQSQRTPLYQSAWQQLKERGHIYPCRLSRKDVAAAVSAPHEEEGPAEPVFPRSLRSPAAAAAIYREPGGVNWRFEVPDGEIIRFVDAEQGPQAFEAGKDFGDFVVWRKDNLPAYELAVVVDDAAMDIAEVVRGTDLLRSTARQLLLYRALGYHPPTFCHLPLVRDKDGHRLAKRHDALSLQALRRRGLSFEDCLNKLENRGHGPYTVF